MEAEIGKIRITKKVLCVILSMILAFGTFVTFTVGYSPLHELLGIRNMLSAYAAELVKTDGAVAVDEEAMIADDHTINLENKDGSNTVYLFSEPISYTDDNGKLKTKDISIEKASSELKKEGFDYTNGQNDYRINFSSDYSKGVQAEYKGSSYSIIPQSTVKVDGAEAVAEYLDENFEVFQYNNIYGNGTNLRFYPQLNGVKDEIVLSKNINKNSFSFELKTKNCTAKLNEDGTISLSDNNGEVIQTFSAPYAYDSEFVEGDKNSHYADCSYSLNDKNETDYIMTITVPEEWLLSENTKYPVVIDPATSNLSQAKDAGIYKKYSTTNFGSEQLCCFGYSTDYDKGRVYTQFAIPSAIKKGATINSAYQWERECTGRTSSTNVIAYLVTQSWTENGVVWAQKPSYTSSYKSNKRNINSSSTDNSSPYWYKFDIKSIINRWVNGQASNYGITFRSDEEDNLKYNWRAFASRSHNTSSYRPYTVINYTNETTAPSLDVERSNSAWTNQNVTFKLKASDSGSGLASSPYSFSNTSGSYSWGTSASKSYSNNQYVYFGAKDNAGNVASASRFTYIDKLNPCTPWADSYTTVWTNQNVNVTIHITDRPETSADGESGISSYSCTKSALPSANSNDWVTASYGAGEYTLSFSETGTYYAYAKDRAGNPSTDDTHTLRASQNSSSVSLEYKPLQIKVYIDKTSPVVSNVSMTDGDNGTKNVTVNAYDLNEGCNYNSGIAAYSLNGTDWITCYDTSYTFNNVNPDDAVNIQVRDKAGNISKDQVVLQQPSFYSENNLIGIYKPDSVSDTLQYKLEGDDNWIDYTVPFAAEPGTVVRARYSNNNKCTNTTTINSNFENLGKNDEVFSYFTVNNVNSSFSFDRVFDNDKGEWKYSTDSRINVVNDYIIEAILPDFTELTFVKKNNHYINELTGYELLVTNGYTLTIDDISYCYNSDGELISISDKFFNEISISRNGNDITVSNGNTTYNAEFSFGKIRKIKDPANNYISFNYTTGENNTDIETVTDQADVLIGKFVFDSNKKLIKTIDKKAITYDNLNRVSSYVFIDNSFINFTYNNNELKINTVSSNGEETETVYNNAGLPITETSSDETVNYVYDNYFRVHKKTNDSETVLYSYNSNGNLISETITQNDITEIITYTYDSNNNLVSKVSDKEGAENSYYTYNNGLIVREVSGDKYLYNKYNSDGTLYFTATPNANFTGEKPAVLTEITEENIALYDVTCYTYNNGNIITSSGSVLEDGSIVSYQTNYTYNELNNVLTAVTGNETVSYIYDSAGRTLLVNNNGRCTRTLYDNLGRIVQEISPDYYESSKDGLPENNTYSDSNAGCIYSYNDSNLVISEKNEVGVITDFLYHPNSSVVSTETFDSYVLTYDIDGKILSSTVNGNPYATYTYNNSGNPILVSYGNNQSIRYEYDDNGNLRKQYHNNSETPYIVYDYVEATDETEIDTEEFLELEENLNSTVNEDYVISHKTNYDSNLYYSFYNSGRVTVAKADNKNSIIYSYISSDEDSSSSTADDVVLGNTYSTVKTENSVTNVFDGKSLAAESTVNNNVTTTAVKYNNATALTVTENEQETSSVKSYGNTITFTDTYSGADKEQISSSSDGTNTKNYTYYADGQLHTVTGNNYSASYVYSDRGNLTEKTVNNSTTKYSYNNDRLISVNGISLTYDSIGNVVAYGNKTYTWSSGRNLSSITDGENSYSYVYNKYGFRTSKTVNGATTDFNVAEDGTIVSQTDGTNSIYFEYANDGSPLGFVLNNAQYIYITNNNSDVMAIADSAGNIIAGYEYDEWGKVTVNAEGDENIALANLNPIRYRGYYYDSETEYYYLQSRYYDPNICRFINADLPEYASEQKNETAGINIFVYCCNDPVNNSDIAGKTSNYSVKSLIRKFVKSYFGSKTYTMKAIKSTKYLYYITIEFKIKVGAKKKTKSIKIHWGNKSSWDKYFLYENNSGVKVARDSIGMSGLPQHPYQALPQMIIKLTAVYFADKHLSHVRDEAIAYEKIWGKKGVDSNNKNKYVMFFITGYYYSAYRLRQNNTNFKKVL